MNEPWLKDLETLLGRPINQQVIIDFFREVLKERDNNLMEWANKNKIPKENRCAKQHKEPCEGCAYYNGFDTALDKLKNFITK